MRCPVGFGLGLEAANSYTWAFGCEALLARGQGWLSQGWWDGGGRGAGGPRRRHVSEAQVAELCGECPACQALYSLLPFSPQHSVGGTTVSPIYRLEN